MYRLHFSSHLTITLNFKFRRCSFIKEVQVWEKYRGKVRGREKQNMGRKQRTRNQSSKDVVVKGGRAWKPAPAPSIELFSHLSLSFSVISTQEKLRQAWWTHYAKDSILDKNTIFKDTLSKCFTLQCFNRMKGHGIYSLLSLLLNECTVWIFLSCTCSC